MDPSPSDSLKTNFDGAIFQESNEAGTGVVIRNFTGEVMAALSEKIAKPSSVSILESIVARRAVQFVCEWISITPILKETLRLLFPLYKIGTCFPLLLDWSPYSRHFVFCLLSQNFSFSHIVRQSNIVAHALAKEQGHLSCFQSR